MLHQSSLESYSDGSKINKEPRRIGSVYTHSTSQKSGVEPIK